MPINGKVSGIFHVVPKQTAVTVISRMNRNVLTIESADWLTGLRLYKDHGPVLPLTPEILEVGIVTVNERNRLVIRLIIYVHVSMIVFIDIILQALGRNHGRPDVNRAVLTIINIDHGRHVVATRIVLRHCVVRVNVDVLGLNLINFLTIKIISIQR